MKILTGELRGRPLHYRQTAGLRPTSDKVRKAVMDILAGDVRGRHVLDLFSGTGAMGFEALSAGAVSAIFVEKNRALAEGIRKNAELLGLAQKTGVLCDAAVGAVRQLAEAGRSFDLIFLDPPYDTRLGAEALRTVLRSGIASPGALFIYESRREELAPSEPGLRFIGEKFYGDTKVTVFGRTPVSA